MLPRCVTSCTSTAASIWRSGNVKTLEGKPLDTTLIALLEFPSEEAVTAFATDPKYAPYAACLAGLDGYEPRKLLDLGRNLQGHETSPSGHNIARTAAQR